MLLLSCHSDITSVMPRIVNVLMAENMINLILSGILQYVVAVHLMELMFDVVISVRRTVTLGFVQFVSISNLNRLVS